MANAERKVTIIADVESYVEAMERAAQATRELALAATELRKAGVASKDIPGAIIGALKLARS